MRTALRARMLRSLNGPALLMVLIGCQADPAPLAQSEGARASRRSVIQLAAAEEAAAEPSSVQGKSTAVQLDRERVLQSPPTAAAQEPAANTLRGAVLLDPPAPDPSSTETTSTDDSADGGGSLEDVDAYLEVARMAHQRGLAALAEKYYFKAVHAYPDSAVAWNDLGQFYLAQQKYAQGVHATQMAVRLEPDSRRYHNNLGELLVRNGRVDEGVREFAAAVGHAAAHYNAGVVLHELGDRAESVRQMKLALAEDAELREARVALEHLAPGAVGAPPGPAEASSVDKSKDDQRHTEGPALKAAQRPTARRHAEASARSEGKSLTRRIRDFFRRSEAPSTTDRRAARYRSQEQPRRGLFNSSRGANPEDAARTSANRPSAVSGGSTTK